MTYAVHIKHNLIRLQSIQNSALRIATGCNKTEYPPTYTFNLVERFFLSKETWNSCVGSTWWMRSAHPASNTQHSPLHLAPETRKQKATIITPEVRETTPHRQRPLPLNQATMIQQEIHIKAVLNTIQNTPSTNPPNNHPGISPEETTLPGLIGPYSRSLVQDTASHWMSYVTP